MDVLVWVSAYGVPEGDGQMYAWSWVERHFLGAMLHRVLLSLHCGFAHVSFFERLTEPA